MNGPPEGGTPRHRGHWEHDLAAGRSLEAQVAQVLQAEPRVLRLRDCSGTCAPIDYELELRQGPIGVELKSRTRRYTRLVSALWPEVPAGRLMVIDELFLRRAFLVGHPFVVVIHDAPAQRWHALSCWSLLVAPRRRYRRRATRVTAFFKGKLLFDLADSDAEADDVESLGIVDLGERTLGMASDPDGWGTDG